MKSIVNTSLLLFSVVTILGEAFKISFGALQISLTLIISVILIFLSIFFEIKFYSKLNDKLVYLFILLILFFSAYGFLQGNAVGDVFEDAYPLVMFCIFYCIFRNFNANDISRMWKAFLFLGVVCSIKVLFINILPITTGWDNNWQATKEPIPFSGAFRIILRGGDLFISIAFVALILKCQYINIKVYKFFISLTLLLYALFISLSRSSYLADALSIIAILFLYRQYFSRKRIILFILIFFVVLVVALPFINIASAAASVFEARTEAFDQGNVATEFRSEEQSIIYSIAKEKYYLGGGLGSFFYLPYSGSEKSDGRSIYSHDFNAWIIFKMGILSLIVFYLLFFTTCINYHKVIKKNSIENRINKYQLPMLLLSSGIVFFIISLWANKVNTFSGSLFFAFFCAAPYVLQKSI